MKMVSTNPKRIIALCWLAMILSSVISVEGAKVDDEIFEYLGTHDTAPVIIKGD